MPMILPLINITRWQMLIFSKWCINEACNMCSAVQRIKQLQPRYGKLKERGSPAGEVEAGRDVLLPRISTPLQFIFTRSGVCSSRMVSDLQKLQVVLLQSPTLHLSLMPLFSLLWDTQSCAPERTSSFKAPRLRNFPHLAGKHAFCLCSGHNMD